MNKRAAGWLERGLFCVLLLGGVANAPAQNEKVTCRFKFRHADSEAVQGHIQRVIGEYAKGKIEKSGLPANTEYLFSVENMQAAQELHRKLMFETSEVGSATVQVFNAEINLEIDYTALNLEATLELTARFKVTPGAQLFLRNPDRTERDVTELVTGNGFVTVPVKLYKGQDYLYARTRSGKVEKFMKIDVYSQDVRYITKDEYDK